MKRVLIDTNVVLDVLLERNPHLAASAAIWDAVESGSAEGYLAAHAITTIHYLAQKQLGARRAKRGCEAIVTRDPRGFRAAGLPVLTPEAAAPLLA